MGPLWRFFPRQNRLAVRQWPSLPSNNSKDRFRLFHPYIVDNGRGGILLILLRKCTFFMCFQKQPLCSVLCAPIVLPIASRS